jgi:hypothetical protein
LESIKKRRAFHFAQLQLRRGSRNVGHQLTPRLTAFGKVIDQLPHKVLEVQRLAMVGRMVTFVLYKDCLDWLKQVRRTWYALSQSHLG